MVKQSVNGFVDLKTESLTDHMPLTVTTESLIQNKVANRTQ